MDRPARRGYQAGTRPGTRLNIWESLLFIVLLILAGYVLFRSPLFAVQRLEVTGTRLLQPDQIRALAGINLGENIFQVDLSQAKQRISLLPMVKTVTVSRVLPSTVRIEVTERTPLVLLQEGNVFAELDADGYYLGPGTVTAAGLPILTGIQASLPAPGQKVTATGLPAVLGFVAGLPPALLPRLSEIHVAGDGSLVLYTLYGVPVMAGDTAAPAQKGALLLAMLQQLDKGKAIAYIDIASVNSPVIKYRN